MDVYNFLQLATDISDVCVRIFDCTRGDFVFENSGCDFGESILDEIDSKGFGEYEVVGYDLYKDMDDECYLELNIEMEEEE